MGIDFKKNYKLFRKYLVSYIKRDGIKEFIEWMDHTDAWVAPASTKYHLCEEGGLIQHSLNVFNRMIRLVTEEWGDIENCPYSKETIAFVSLLHDVSKINFYDTYLKNVKDDHGQWIQVPTYTVREENNRLVFGTHEENSVYILTQFFKLDYQEAVAIRWHGGCGTSNDPTSQGKMMEAYKASKLALLLHIADMQATCIDEVDMIFGIINNDSKKEEQKEVEKNEVAEDKKQEVNEVDNQYTNSKYIEDEDEDDVDEQDFERAIDEANDCPF